MNIYALGSNGSGQLGLDHLNDVSSPHHVELPALLRQDIIKTVTAGGNHTLILTTSGQLYATGSSTDGRCCLSVGRADLTTFTQVNLYPADMAQSTRVELCVATWEASIIVTTSGKVLVCGTGLKGELGLGSISLRAESPQSLPDFPPQGTHIIDLAACMGHVVAVLSNGELWGWGNGQNGQLGEPAGVVQRPRKFEEVPFNAVRAVCGKDFTCVFGDPLEGRLAIIGLKKRDRYDIKPHTPEHVQNWKEVQASWGGVYVLLESGELIAWGRNDHGQLPPAKLPALKAISAGSEHAIALTNSGKTLAWGWGEHGNCAEPTDDRSNVKDRWNELKVPGDVLAIAAGCATSFIITSALET